MSYNDRYTRILKPNIILNTLIMSNPLYFYEHINTLTLLLYMESENGNTESGFENTHWILLTENDHFNIKNLITHSKQER